MDSGTGIKVTHILLIEDEKAHQDLVLRAFRNDPEKFRVSVAGNLREARQILERDLPDLILSDWILPDGKGLDILVRTDGAVTIPLIIMTGYGDEHLAVEIMKSGAIDYVVKSATVFHDLPHITRKALRDWENIHERKRAEEAVRDSEKRLADIISFLPDAVLAIDNDGRVIAWNEAIEQMTGVAAAEMLMKGNYEYSLPFYGERRPILIDLILIEDEEIEKKYLTLQRDGERISSEVYIPTLFGGKGAYLWGTVSPLYDNAGKRIGAIEIIRDITERKRVELELVSAQRKLTEAQSLAHIGNWDWDIKNDTVTWSEELYNLAGRDPSLPAPTYTEHPLFYTPSSWDLLNDAVTSSLTTGEPYNLELELIRSDRSIRWVNAFGGVKRDVNGKVIGLYGTLQDIDERKKARQALYESETRFKDLFNNMNAGVAIYDVVDNGEDFIFRDLNRAAETIDHVKRQDLPGKSVLEIFPSVREFGLFSVFQRVAKTGIAESHPVSMYRDDRISGWRENYVYKLPSGEIVVIYEDVTEKKQAVETLRQSEEKFRSMVDTSPDMIWEIDLEGNFSYISSQSIEQLGYNQEDLIGKPFYSLIQPESIPAIKTAFRTHVQEKSSFSTLEVPAKRSDGSSCIIEIRSVPITGNDGQLMGFRGLARDITDKKQAEQALQESQERYRMLFNSIDEGFCIIEMIFDKNEKPVDYRFLEINPSFEKQTGLIDAKGRRMRELAPKHEEHWFEIYGKIALTGQPARFVNRAEQLHRWYDVYAFRFGQLENHQVAVLFNDITEKIKADEKLHESEDRFRHISGLITDIAYSCKRPTGGVFSIDWITGAVGRITGFSDNEILAMGCWRGIVIEEDYPIFDEKITGLSPGHSSQCDLRIRSKDGVIHWLSCFTECVSDPAHPGYHILFGGCRDITENKQTEEIRNAYQVRLDSAMDIGSLAWWEMDLPDGAVRFDDRKATLLLRSPEDFHHYTDFTDLLHPEDYGPAMQAMKDHLEGKEARYHADYRILSSDGNYRWFRDVGGITSRHPDGSPATITGIVIDITTSKKAEEALRQSEARYRLLADNIADVLWVLNIETGKWTYMSPSVERLRGYTTEEVLAQSVEDVMTPASYGYIQKLIPERIQRFLSNESGQNTYLDEIEQTCRDGSTVWTEVASRCLRNERGELVLLGLSRDISERKLAETALRATETRFSALIQNSSDIIRILDRNGRILYESPSAERILGYPPGYLIGRDPMEYIHADDLERVKNDFKEVIDQTNPGTPTEFRIRKADGEYLWVDSIGTNLLEVPGVNGIVITTRPIQQRKQAETQIKTTLSQLEQNEALLRKVYDILPIGLWLADKNGTLLYGNPAGVKIWGAEPHVPIDQYGIFKARHYPSGEEIAADDWALARTIHEGVTIKDELLEIDAFDGKKKIIVNYTAPLYDASGTIDGAIVVNQEITDKVQAEKALRDNQARLATAMDIANLVNWEFDIATGMFTFDDRFYALYETTADREGGNQMSAETYMREFVYPDDRPAVLAAIQKNITITDPSYTGQIEHRITPRDGSVRTIIVRYAPVMGPDGKVIRIFGANQDITDRMLMESEIRSLNIVLEQRVKDRTEALVETNEKLKQENVQRLEAEGKLQASFDEKVMLLKEIHHRVKNNLQIIASLLNLQSRYITDEKTLAAIRESQNRVKAMALVHEKLYRSEDIAHISLHEYLRFLGTGLFQFYDARVRGIQFKLEISDIDVDIDAAIPIGLIINELISNSLKYAFPEGRTGEVSISVKKEGHTLNVLFHDTGIGIPADLDWRDAPSLGLRLVNTLVDQMNGTIELDRSDGTTFTMVLHEKEPRGEK